MDSFKLSETTIYTFLSTTLVSIFIVASFFIPFSLPLYILCLGLASIFIFKKPEVGLYSIIILIIIFGISFSLLPLVWDENIYKIYPLDILILITLASFLFYKLRNSEVKIQIGKLGILILVFCLFSLFSMLYGLSKGGEFALAFSTFKNYALYSIFFFLTINIIRKKEQLDYLIKTFLVSGLLLLTFVVVGYFSGKGIWIETTPLSTVGTRLLAPAHAFYLSIAILFSLNLVAFKRKIFGQLTTLIILVQLLGVIGSLTRHLWLALFFVSVLTFLLLSKEYKKNLLRVFAFEGLFVMILIIIYILFGYILTGEANIFGLDYLNDAIARFKSLYLYSFEEDTSIYYRLFSWQKALKLLQASPFLGIGFGQKLTFDVFGWPMVIVMRDLHNNFIGMIVQMGVLGFLSFLTFNVYFLKQAFILMRKVKKDFYPYLLGALGCYVLFIFSANFNIYFDLNIFVIFFWIILGIVVLIERFSASIVLKK